MKIVRLALFALIAFGVILLVVHIVHGHPVAILDPKGIIASKERNLIIVATLLMLIVVIPVFILTFAFAWKYRATNTKAIYTPDWDHNSALETTWWLIPTVLVAVLGVIAWQSSHQLDPYKPIASATPTMTIQVVALQWKWLFIYPQQHIATVNYVQFPQNTPVTFHLTADAPMNSFWVPQLGGQIYAMPGMSTQLNLMASGTGSYYGESANISGIGFAGMHFTAKSTSEADFNQWVGKVKQSGQSLNPTTYTALAKPSQNLPPAGYASAQTGLYDTIITKYLTAAPASNSSMAMSGMSMP